MTINMKYNLPDRILRELSFLAKKYSVTKIILFVPVHEAQIQKEVI